MSNSLQPHGLYSPPGSSVPGILQAKILDLSDPGIELRSLALQADSLPTEPPGKPPLKKFDNILTVFTINLTNKKQGNLEFTTGSPKFTLT